MCPLVATGEKQSQRRDVDVKEGNDEPLTTMDWDSQR